MVVVISGVLVVVNRVVVVGLVVEDVGVVSVGGVVSIVNQIITDVPIFPAESVVYMIILWIPSESFPNDTLSSRVTFSKRILSFW